jgi:low temperature requirement protein LtrA
LLQRGLGPAWELTCRFNQRQYRPRSGQLTGGVEQVTNLLQQTRLRYIAGQTPDRKVTWLELFFDLVFAAAVAQAASPLRSDYSIAGLGRFVILFVLIWWAWTGHAVFSTRFDTDDAVQRALTLLQMFGVAVMAANARDALDSRSSAGFAAAYAVLRFVLVFQYLRARAIHNARQLATWYAVGHGVAAGLWLVSALAPVPLRYFLWAAAFALDLGTPWAAVRHSVTVPPDAAHLPERFGLFTLILLGESVVAVMHGIEHQEYWNPVAATSAFTGMAVAFGIWWWYFDVARATSPRPYARIAMQCSCTGGATCTCRCMSDSSSHSLVFN